MTGETGFERIAIIDDFGRRASTSLTMSDREFVTTSSNITIIFYNDFGEKRGVYFYTDGKVDITSPILFEDWKCGSMDENINCKWVREGRLSWEGFYEIEFHGRSIHLNERSVAIYL